MLVALAGLFAVWWFLVRTRPQQQGVIVLPGLSAPVVVRLDARMIPAMRAASESDLYAAQGYVTARDRMFQMDMLRRAAEGRLAAVFGIGSLAQDRLMRTVGCRRLADEELRALTAPTRAMLESYCRGVNLFLQSAADRLPPEFSLLAYRPEPWEPADTLAVMKYIAYLGDESWRLDDLRQRIRDRVGAKEAGRLFAEETYTASPAVPGKTDREPGKARSLADSLGRLACASSPAMDACGIWGSTAWVVSGRLGDRGGCLLACAKDQTLTAPDLWYLCSLAAPGLHVAGATIPGVPGIVAGRNDDIAWAGASLKADVQDLFLEEFSPGFPGLYRDQKGWQPALELTEEIQVRLGPNVLHKVMVTGHGPVLLREGTGAVSLAWTGGTAGTPQLESLYLLNRARSWPEFRGALKLYTGPAELFVYADRAGNIGCQAAGQIPVRGGGGDGMYPVPGWGARGQWTARVAYEELPSTFNPPCGYLVAANQKMTGPGYRWLIGHQWAAPYRAMRVATCLSDAASRSRPLGLSDMNDLQADQLAYLSSLVKRELRQALAACQVNDRLQLSAFERLARWDGTLKPESSAAAVCESFLQTLARRLIVAKIGPALAGEYMERWPAWPVIVEAYLKDRPAGWLPPEERTHEVFLLTTFSQALKNLRLSARSDDPDRWSWQSFHKAVFRHAVSAGAPWLGWLFDVGPVGVGGDADTVDALDITGDTTSGRFLCRHGATLRLLIDEADPDKFYGSLSLGQSGHPLDGAARDQLKGWLRVDPLPVAFSPEQVERQSQHSLILTGTINPGSE